jgi:hypothetical protein
LFLPLHLLFVIPQGSAFAVAVAFALVLAIAFFVCHPGPAGVPHTTHTISPNKSLRLSLYPLPSTLYP